MDAHDGAAALLFHRATLAEQASFYSATSAIDDDGAHDSATPAAAAQAAGGGRVGAVVGTEPAPLRYDSIEGAPTTAPPTVAPTTAPALPVGDRWAAWGLRGGGDEPPAWPRPPSIAQAEAEAQREAEREESAQLGAMRESLFPHPSALAASGMCSPMTPTTTPMGGARRAEQPLTRSADWWGGGGAGEETPVWLQKLKDGLVPSEVRSPLIALDEPDNQKLKDGLVPSEVRPRRRATESAHDGALRAPLDLHASAHQSATHPPPSPQVPSQVSLYYHAAPHAIEVLTTAPCARSPPRACKCSPRRPRHPPSAQVRPAHVMSDDRPQVPLWVSRLAESEAEQRRRQWALALRQELGARQVRSPLMALDEPLIALGCP
jgi:hypothetical protein